MRLNAPDVFFHVYNRGVAKMNIFLCDEDYQYFEHLLERHLSRMPQKDKQGREYCSFYGKVEIHTYCLMPNHFHFLIHQVEEGVVQQLFSRVTIAYSMYFNKKYDRRGPLFESRYKAVMVENDEYLTHVSRYIHLNPLGFRSWEYSSYNDYLYEPRTWLTTDFILDMFQTKKHYLAFVDDYRDKDGSVDALPHLFGDI